MFKYLLIATLVIAIAAVAAVLLRARTRSAAPATATGSLAAPLPAPKDTQQRHWLLGVGGEVEGRNFHIGSSSITVGRTPGNKIQLTSQDASRTHTRLSPAPGGGLMITDMKSNNGTYVNGERIQTCVLEDGDAVRIAGAKFTYRETGDFVAVELLRERKAIGRHIVKSTELADQDGLKAMIAQTLSANGGDVDATAEQLGLDAGLLRNMAQKYGIAI